MELAAAEAWKGADVCEAPGDPYTAQLAKSRAAKVDSAEKLLARAKADPKVQKVLKKPKTTKSTGDTKGRGSSKTPKVPPKSDGAEHDEVPPADPTSTPEVIDGWDEKDRFRTFRIKKGSTYVVVDLQLNAYIIKYCVCFFP